MEIIFAKPEGLELAIRKWKDLNCCTFFIYDLKQNIMENPFEIIIEKLDNIETLLKQICNTRNGSEIPLSNTNEIMNLEQLAKYVNQSKSAMYKQTSSRTIPFYKNGKRVYFKKSEIDAWLTKTKISTADEIEEKALNYIIKRGKVWK
jgi:excisionase family DNA binding protein